MSKNCGCGRSPTGKCIGWHGLTNEEYSAKIKNYLVRHFAKPGITGWAQVNGRNAISWNKKFELDVWYINNINFLLDVKIIFMTIKKIFVSEGINQNGQATVEVFNGEN